MVRHISGKSRSSYPTTTAAAEKKASAAKDLEWYKKNQGPIFDTQDPGRQYLSYVKDKLDPFVERVYNKSTEQKMTLIDIAESETCLALFKGGIVDKLPMGDFSPMRIDLVELCVAIGRTKHSPATANDMTHDEAMQAKRANADKKREDKRKLGAEVVAASFATGGDGSESSSSDKRAKKRNTFASLSDSARASSVKGQGGANPYTARSIPVPVSASTLAGSVFNLNQTAAQLLSQIQSTHYSLHPPAQAPPVTPLSSAAPNLPPWTCGNCSAQVGGAMSSCWKCGIDQL